MSRIVVIGSGIAGLIAAVEASRKHEVTLVTKANLAESNTHYAQGGIAAVVSTDDTVAEHIADTLTAGAGLCSPEAVDVLCTEGPARINDLIEKGAHTISICNTQGATIPRESDAVVYTHAGPEVAVASTKAFVAQITALYLIGLHAAAVRGTTDVAELRRLTAELEALPAKITQVLKTGPAVAQLAKWMSDSPAVLFLGRHVGYPIALEGALKLKELAYIHAEGFAAGELKHGPIALIDNGQPVFVVVPSPIGSPLIHSKVVSNIQEIRARGARVIAIAEQGDAAVLPYADEVIPVPLADPMFEPILAVVPLQIFAMELADAKGLDVDQPRNLAKSVTVE